MRRFLCASHLTRFRQQTILHQQQQKEASISRQLSSSNWLNQTASSSGGKKSRKGSFSMSATSVVNDKAGSKFTLDLGNNQVARIEYKPIGRNKIEMYHTEVPSELRGRGIGKALAKGALDNASASNVKVKLTCSYLIDYINKSADPKYKKMVEK